MNQAFTAWDWGLLGAWIAVGLFIFIAFTIQLSKKEGVREVNNKTEEALKRADEAFSKAMSLAGEAFDLANAEIEKTYDEAVVKALKDYDDAEAQIHTEEATE